MRPHALSLTAFGPFAGTVSLDLDALSSAGLFLLHGATGAGKSTLLDGIGFALFGRVPGVRNSAKRLRCDSAAPSVRTTVSLEATFGGRRVRITRSPSYARPKTRGAGETVEQARVLLEELRDGTWEVLSSRPREADDEVLDLVGMSAEQFFQVVLLPQGEFASFLRASSVDRVELLKKLFATERFADVESWLAGRRRVTAERVVAARTVVETAEARVLEASGASSLRPTLLAEATEALARAEEQVAVLTVERDLCRAAAVEAARVAGLQERRRGLLLRADRLVDERPARLRLSAELDAAVRAAAVEPLLRQVAARRAARDAALEAVTSSASVADLRSRFEEAVARRGELSALRSVDEARRDALGVVGRARADQADALALVGSLEVELSVLPARRSSVEAHVLACRAAAADLPRLQAERDVIAALRPDVVALSEVSAAVVGLHESHLAARETALSLEVKAHDLHVASVSSMVARLAAMLEDGMPCEVCGSEVHPDPSALRDEGVSVEDEQQARRLADEAGEVVVDLGARLAAARSREEALADRVGSWTLAELDARLAELDLELDVVLATATQLDARELDLTALDTRRASLKEDHVAASERAAAAERRAAEASERAVALAAELEAAGAADLVAAWEHALAEVAASGAALSSAEALEAATLELTGATVVAENACTAGGFTDLAEAAAAVRPASWRLASEEELRRAADEEATVKAELADPTLQVSLDVPAPVTSTAEALATADSLLSAAAESAGISRERVAALTRLLPELAAAQAALAPLERTAAEVRALADLCAGGGANGLKMTLTSFVLAARLEEVAAAATVRLLRMTQGRYELIHTDDAARGGARSGLGLLVRDAWSGQDRDTATLSGGETFLAALSLALGLADVVTAEAGGARIGALFVDEGFGTLDEETLDEVMDVLDGLREGGRVVGLVSHVGELRQRIPTRVEVRKDRSGSEVVVHGC